MNICLVPFTRQALKHPKVGHMLGKGGASQEMTVKLNELKSKYSSLKEQVSNQGVNDFVFNLLIPIYKKTNFTKRPKTSKLKHLWNEECF